MAAVLLTFASLLLRGIASTADDHIPAAEITVKVADAQGNILILPLETYCVGVLAAEMPASFAPEALKAQAMAIRTYAIYAKNKGGRHEGYDLCATTHCQVWHSDAQLQSKWGSHYAEYKKKITAAVTATRGCVITYQSKLISPVYHSTCGSKTESAAAYWGKEVPYLQSVECFCTNSPKAKSEVSFSYTELAERLGQSEKAIEAMKVIKTSSTGRVQEVQCGNTEFSGQKLRELLGLNSTDFIWQEQKDGLAFEISGYGHGVGLCQYGANQLAKNGWTAENIVLHYYQGVKIEKVY